MGRRRRSARGPRPRRRPKRASGEAIVEAILQASAQLLERDGVDGLNTNRVARVAGVSIGSLYQYFPDKHALVAELARGLEGRGVELGEALAGELREADGRHGTWSLVGVPLDPTLGSVTVRRALLREVPRGWIRGATREADEAFEALIARFVARRARDFRDTDPDVVAFVCFHAAEGVIEGALLHDPAMLHRPWLREELFRVVWRYAAAEGQPLDVPERSPLRFEPPALDPPSAPLLERLAQERSGRVDTSARAKAATDKGRRTAARILDAAARILVDEGMAALSARRVAQEAGISVGGLYRRFRNKQAIVAELARRLEERSRALFAERLAAGRDAALPDAIEAIVRLFLTPEVGDPRLRQALLVEVPRRWTEESAVATERAAVEGVAAQLRARAGAIREGDPERMAFVVCRAIEAIAESALIRNPGWIDDGRLARECVDLALRYLRR
ncbi:MAG TPA: TetR family transcriptional regulator [Sandaracinaceae bacterium LLY-WYZ-13_1]|nr:TetR family transcriptional regulator [Sandaracinaceae bacterium LLY-WYZ-13_1]